MVDEPACLSRSSLLESVRGIHHLPVGEVARRKREGREIPGALRYAGAPGGGTRGRHPLHHGGGDRRDHEGSYTLERIKLTVHHLYADMMNLYGDRGNVISIKKRCEWRGIPVEVVDVGLGVSIAPTGCDLFLFGGGQDREQTLLVEDLSGKKGADLRAIVEDGGVVLGVCGGYQLMGHSYETPEGEKLPGVGVFDLYTEPRKPDEERLIGNVLVRVRGPENDEVREIVGFENHGGRTYLGDGLESLVLFFLGFGNNRNEDS